MKLNFRQRSTLFITAYTFLLIFIVLSALWLSFELLEQSDDESYFDELGSDIQSALHENVKSGESIKTLLFDVYSARTGLPNELKNYTEFGIHILENEQQLIIGNHANSDEKYYLVFHLSTQDNFIEEEIYDIIFIIFSTIFTTALVIFLVQFMAKRLSLPVIELQEMVCNIDINSNQLPILKREDEIGELSQHFSDLIIKMRKFAQRESDFTRFASHELRTPITIIRGNFDLLEKTIAQTDLNQRTLSRMNTAINRMHNLIEVFLWLGREDKEYDHLSFEQLKRQQLQSMLTQVVDNLPKAEQSKVQFNLENISWYLKPEMLSMVVDNLLRNALRHGQNSIQITARENYLSISNETSVKVNSLSLGIGLQIVERICEANKWQLSINNFDDNFCIKIIF